MAGPEKNWEIIERNLYDFYFMLAKVNGLHCQKEKSPMFVKNQAGKWPSYILGNIPSGDQAAYIKELTVRMNSGGLPAFWIMKEPPEPESLYGALAESGIRPVTRWTGMMLVPGDYLPPEPSCEELVIRVLDSGSHVGEWTDLVNNELFQREAADPELFTSLPGHPAFRLYSALVEDKIVATALAYTHQGVSGLYLISTDSRYRRKGIGGTLASFAVKDCLSRKSGSIVLHATRAGKSVYGKIGFREYCNFDILWMLGKS